MRNAVRVIRGICISPEYRQMDLRPLKTGQVEQSKTIPQLHADSPVDPEASDPERSTVFFERYETKIHSSISYPRVAQTPDPTDSVRSQSFRFNHTSGSCSAHFKGRQKMTIHLDNKEAHLLQTMLKVELMRVTSVLYAKEIKPLADCIEGLLDKLQPKQKM